jgi:ABC-type lipoprotein export system ATPase subunit
MKSNVPDGNAGAPLPSPLITVRNLHKSYRRGHEHVEALRGIDLDIEAGSFAVIIGPSGGGKSTFLRLLGGLDSPTLGQIRVNNLSLEEADENELTQFRRDHIGFVFQFYYLLSSLNTLDNVLLPLLARRWRWRDAKARAKEVLEQVGLSHRETHKPGQLSGGEQQRVAIARAIIGRPCLLIADEPTGDLDSATAESVLDLMAGLNREQAITCLVATHDLQVARYATHLYEMRDGRLHPALR